MTAAYTTLRVDFVSESAGYQNTFGWYNKVTGVGGVLFAGVEAEGSQRSVISGVSQVEFTVNTADLGNIEYFLIPNGGDIGGNSDAELSRPIKVIRLGDGSWAVATLNPNGTVQTGSNGKPNILQGQDANAFFTEKAKNEGGVDHASSTVGSNQTAATLAGDQADGAVGQIAWEDLAATRKANGTWTAPGDADYNDAVFRVSIRNDRPDAGNDNVTIGENAGATTINVLANDSDANGDAIKVTAISGASGVLGTIGIAAGGSGIVFNPGVAYQFLGAGESRTESFSYTVTDASGAADTATVKVTIVGANDAPVVVGAGDLAGSVAERADGAANENSGSLGASGQITFTDVDASDNHTVSVSAQGSGYRGTLTAVVSDGGDCDPVGAVTWNYAVAASALDNLSAGQTLTQLYTVTISDGEGGTVARTVAITLVGSNDKPVITSAASAATVTELADGSAGENTTTHTATGNIAFADVDLADAHIITVTPTGSGYRGALTASVSNASTGDGSGAVTWVYSVNDAALDNLAAGQTLTQSYKVKISDGQGGTVEQTVTITIKGASDSLSNGVPVIISGPQSGAAIEIGDNATGENTATHSQSGTVTFSDANLSDTHTALVVPQGAGYRGSLTLGAVNQAGDSVGWTFSVADGALDDLQAGQVLTQKYDVSIDDGHSGTATTTITVTLTGTNDAPAITSSAQSGSAAEIADHAASENATTHSANGAVTFADVDTLDIHSASFVPQAGGYLGSFSLGALNQSGGSVGWTFSVADSALDALAAGQTLTQLYSVSVNDGHGGTATQTVTITLTGTNDAAVLSSDTRNLVEGNTAAAISTSGTLTVNDIDGPATFVAQGATVGAYGTFAINSAGAWTYTASSAHNEFVTGTTYTDTFSVASADGTLTSVTVNILGANDSAILSSDIRNLTEANTAAAISTSGTLTVSDVDSPAIFVAQAATVGSYGSFSIGSNGAWSYTASSAHNEFAAGTTYTDTFSVSSADGTVTSVTVNILGTNDAAVLSSDTRNLTEAGTAAAISTGGTLTVSDVDSPATFVAQSGAVGTYGTFAINTAGAWTYTASSAHNEFVAGTTYTDTFNVSSADGTATSVTVNVLGTNDAAVLSSDTRNLTEAGTAGAINTSGMLTVSDVDSPATFVAQAATVGSYGTFAINTAGVWTYTASSAHNEFVAGTTYTDTFSVGSADGTATSVTVNILGTNDAAVLSSDSRNLTEANTAAAISTGGTLTVSDIDSPATFVAQAATVGSYGTFAINAAGAWTYTASSAHNEFAAGTTYIDTFSVSSADGTATSVTVNILGTNDAAVLSSDTRNLTEANTAAAISTGGTLTVSDIDSPATFVAQAATVGSYGSFAINAAGAWTYTASSAHNEFAAGTTYIDTFSVSSADGTATSVTVNILGTNDAAVLSSDTRNLTEADTAAAISTGGTLTISDVDSPQTFVAQAATVGAYGTFAINSAGAWTYTASSAHNEFVTGTTYTDTFSVASADGTLTSVTVNILGANDSAILSSDIRNLTEANTAAAISTSGTLTVSDVDSPAIFVAQAATVGSYGSFSIGSNGAWSYTASSAHNEFAAGTTYTDTFSVSSADGTVTSVTVNILGTNDAAVLSSDTRNLTEANTAVAISTSGTLTVSDADGPATFVAQSGAVGTYGTFAINTAGAWTYTASSAHNEFVAGTTYTDTFSVSSADGTSTSVTVSILGTNDAAVLSPATANLTEADTAAAISTGGTLTISDVDSPATFVAQAATAGSYGTFAINSAGAWTYTASSAHNEFVAGTTYADTFSVSSADGTATSVTVNILGTNDAAVLSSDTRNLTEADTAAAISTGGTLTISDVDSPATFVAQAATAGSYGTFAISTAGAWSYTASTAHNEFAAGTTYTDTFSVSSADGTLTSVTINILGTNDATVLSSDTRNLTEADTAAAISASGTLTISNIGSPQSFVAQAGTAGSYGAFSIDSAGAWSYTASSAHNAFVAGATYTDSFSVASTDGTLTSVTINILGTNDAAVLSSAAANLTEADTAAAISTGGMLAISDVDSPATFVAQAATVGSYGSFSIDTAGAWSYTASSAHNEFAAGTTYLDTFSVASADGTLTSVTVDILGTNDAAVLSSATVNLTEADTAAAISAGGTLTISDVDSPQTFVAQAATVGSYGTFSIGTNGVWSYNASSAHNEFAAGTTHNDTFSVASADGTLTSVTVSILGTNDAAVLSSATVNRTEADTAAAISTSGTLTISDVDSPATFVAQAGTAGLYGSFSIGTSGAWTYTASSAHNEFAAGATHTDTFSVLSADGTATSVTVNILGTNDAPVAVADTNAGNAVIEAGIVSGVPFAGDPSATGNVLSNDTDSDADDTRQVQGVAAGLVTGPVATGVGATITGVYGSVTVAADGAWTYTLDNADPDTNALSPGQNYADVFSYTMRDTAGATHTTTLIIAVTGTSDVQVVDLTTLTPSLGFIIQGDVAGDRAGYSVASAGDINGDGFADLIVGAQLGDDGGIDAGEAYVVYGKASGFGTVDGTGRRVIDLTSPGTQGFIIQGDKAGDHAGYSVAAAGDVNGDGFADLIVGAPEGDDGGTNAGEAYVVFGKAAGFGPVIDLSSLGSQGFIIRGNVGPGLPDQAGYSVAAAGDVNGDGFADVIVGAPGDDDGGLNAGAAYVVFGKATGFGTVTLTSLGSQGFGIRGADAIDQAGYSVAAAGDVNGDGFADVIVGVPLTGGNNFTGEAYVVFGQASGFGTGIDLSSLGSQGFIIRADQGGDEAGYSVAAAGDVNGDGFADLIVGAIRGDDGGTDAGEAYVVFGKAAGFGTVDGNGNAVIDLSSLGSQGFIIQGDKAGDQAGFSVAAAGDVNGDGFADLIVGAPLGDDGGIDAGEAYVVFGKAAGFGRIDLTNLGWQGMIIRGDGAGDQAGSSVAAAGDINGDGFADLIIGAPDGDDGGTDAGEAYVVFGAAFGASAAPVATTGTAAAEIQIGGVGNDTLSGGGGADVFHAGAGNDTITVPDMNFRLVDGGSGTDTLVLPGSGQSFDFTALADNRIAGIEAIDITGSGNNILKLGMNDVLNMSDTENFDFSAAHSHNSLVVKGDTGDALWLNNFDPDGAGPLPASTWQSVATGVGLDGAAGGSYNIYDLIQNGAPVASVAVDSHLAFVLV